MKTVLLSYLPWVLVCILALSLAVALALLAYLFSFLMSGAWYRWKHKGALRERDVLYEVRKKILLYKTTTTGDLPGPVCAEAVQLIDEVLIP
jgi:hypothetical protein